VQDRRVWNVAARVAWALLLLVHIVPVVAVISRLAISPSPKSMLSLAALIGIMAIAGLKAVDVPWLRLRLSRKSWCALIMVALLIHGDFVAKQIPDYLVLQSTITLTIAVTVLTRRFLKNIQKSFAASCCAFQQALSYWLQEIVCHHVAYLSPVVQVPRGPPLR